MALQEARERVNREYALKVVAEARCCDCGQLVDRPENPGGEYAYWRGRVRVCLACVNRRPEGEP